MGIKGSQLATLGHDFLSIKFSPKITDSATFAHACAMISMYLTYIIIYRELPFEQSVSVALLASLALWGILSICPGIHQFVLGFKDHYML